ncbi:hypothetical protein PHYBOEH_001937 [Phytophthora boehmeriae]|uniref:C2 domain-containing protein n=1 Tax=Phytophthora boehmeriae TaxID=109152 RepID=A0A8T1WXY5_9STRA|nr:hypothetical protein PHYBOEH_001937 [Phytophthora boehmeriae]
MDNSDVETLREEEAEEMTAECPPSVSITIPAPPAPNEASCYARLSPTCSEVTYDEDDRESISSAPSISIPPSIETSPTLTTRSQGSRSSFDGFHNGSTALVDRELVAQACASLARTAAEIQALDLSTNTKKPRRALKSLRALSELTNLVQLDVSGNAVERLDGLQVLIQLQSLALARNNLKSLGAPLFALKNLTSLDLSGNFIVHLPRAFSDLTSIEVLNLSGNSLATLREVDVLAPLANLLACNLAANPFCRLPTYKDYVICKIRSLERLDDMPISTVARDRAAKRFGTAMFSQDACLREAGRVHESEQNRLLMAQSALEAENLRLKGELQVKSKLLQNKSRAWSSATEQLLQLQQEVAMLNLDRRRSMSLSDDQPNSAEKIAMAIAGRSRACDQQRPQSALPRISSPKRSIEKRSGSFSETDQHRNWSQEGENEAGGPSETSRQTTSPTRSPESKHAQESTTSPTKTKESTHLQQGTTSLSKPQGFKHTKESTTSPAKPHGPNNTQQSNTDSSEADTDQILIKRNRDKSLQSCKQSLLTEIKNEEHILHVLKRESLQYEDQIDRLSVNIQACLDGDPSAIKLSFASSGSPRRGSKKRQEETGRAQLEILRNKLRFAEDKEKEIEMTMVRMTKRVLQADLNPSERANAREKFSPIQSPMSSDTPFDKEIFALTHRLQLVIVEKEEIHMQMSQLMASLRNQNGSDAGIPGLGFDEDDGDSMNDKIDSRKHAQSLAKSRQMMDDLRTRHREVTDRIHIKEQRISTLLEELKEVELELEHISRLNVSSALSPLFQRERAASMEFLHNMRSRLKREGIIKTGSETDASGTWSHSEAGDDIQDSQPFTEFVNEQEGNIMNPQTSILNPESNELFSPDEIEKIKADIYEKMSKQLTASTGGVNKENSTGIYREDLHAAIAAALETRLQLSLGSHDPGKSEDICEFNQVGASEYNNHQNEQLVVNEDLPDVVVASDEICCDEFDEFAQVEAYYAKKYVLAKDRAAMFLKSCSEDEANVNSTQLTGAQRILKMCERLDVAEAQYKVDPVSKIELDQLGKHRSSLKISLLTARDLPTTHLRTKNLDPYVSFEVVYPPHAVPPPLSDREEKVFRSRTKKKSIYPVWDEDFDFSPILSLNGYLHVRVLNDRRLSREQLVGETRIPLHTLMHQRRIVEWFSLGLAIPPASTGSVPPGRIVTKVCGGAIRLQLHLTFSSVERYKRVVDELVTKYVLEHNQLPEFIDSVEDCDKRAEPGFGSEQPEHNGAEIMTVMHDEVGSVSFERLRQSDVEPHFPLEIETSLPVYNGWQRDTPAQQVHFHEDTKDQVSASRTSTHEISTRLSAERAKALWEPKTSDRPVDSGKTVAMIDRKPATGSSSNGSGRKKQQRTASSGALHRAQSKLRRSASLHQHMSLRRKRVEAPECFDEYSPYHPGFNNTDLLENGNNELLRNDHLRSGSFVSRGADANRKTDLRIFKSPSVSRRPPSTGFPERYIGLDNQTCERLKRIIGRMDGS